MDEKWKDEGINSTISPWVFSENYSPLCPRLFRSFRRTCKRLISSRSRVYFRGAESEGGRKEGGCTTPALYDARQIIVAYARVESARVSFSFAFLLPVGVKKERITESSGRRGTWMIFARVRSGFPMLIFIVKRAIESVSRAPHRLRETAARWILRWIPRTNEIFERFKERRVNDGGLNKGWTFVETYISPPRPLPPRIK